MARKVLNKPVSSGGGAAIKSVATTKTTRLAISGNSNDTWHNGNGFSAILNRQEADSRVLIDSAWRCDEGSHSYFAGMGIQSNYPSGSSKTHGWGYIWEHNTGDGDQGLFHCMKGLYDGHGLNNQTGNFTFKFGWESVNGSSNRPGEVWTASRADDATGNANDMSYFTFIEISDSNTSWNNNSGGNS